MSDTEQLMLLVNTSLLTTGLGLIGSLHNDPTPGSGLSTVYLGRVEAFLYDSLLLSTGAVLSFNCEFDE